LPLLLLAGSFVCAVVCTCVCFNSARSCIPPAHSHTYQTAHCSPLGPALARHICPPLPAVPSAAAVPGWRRVAGV
jgi:hypothetical protein